jgi:ABC-type transport system involved in multi-copper enzyme maturation permease subunit
MTSVPFSFRRAFLIAQNTWREAARQKLFNFLLFLALALVLGARWFRDFNFGAPELKFLADCGFGAMAFFGAALTVAATAQLFFSEIENRTALTLLAKPVWRAEFVIGKFLGVAMLSAVFCALLTALLAGVLWWRCSENI